MITRILLLSIASLSLLIATPVLAAEDNGRFPDVPDTYPYVNAITDLTKNGTLHGYDDGYFRPNDTVNRAEFLGLIYRSNAALPAPETPTEDCFPDVPADLWYAPYVCAAKDSGAVTGTQEGTFSPTDRITLADAAKILTSLLGLPIDKLQEGEAWHAPYLRTLGTNGYLLPEFIWNGQEITRGQLAELLWRYQHSYHEQPQIAASDLSADACQLLGDEPDTRIDMVRVRAAWFSWLNAARAKRGLAAYEENLQLDRTALAWSKTQRAWGVATHHRVKGDSYYNYARITNWFATQGLTFGNWGGNTFSENIGRGQLKCTDSDCTDELIIALHPTFDMYMREAGRAYRPHWNSIMNRGFTQVGAGIALQGTAVYLTTHYATELTSDPLPVCQALKP